MTFPVDRVKLNALIYVHLCRQNKQEKNLDPVPLIYVMDSLQWWQI